MPLDLHGYHTHDGWKRFMDEVDDAYDRGVKSFKVITGKGQMRVEFRIWAENHSKVRKVELNKDGGSFKVTLRKKPLDKS